MNVSDLVKTPGAWMGTGPDSGTVISCRVRLARNLGSVPFPGWADDATRGKLWRFLREAMLALPSMKDAVSWEMSELDPVDKEVLLERHLISPELSEKGAGSGVVVTRDESVAIMVNEEDHLRLQAIRPGMDLAGTWRRIDGLDTELEARVPYAFARRWGYLTACPTNLGTGLRASALLHLPGLVLMNEIDPIIKGLAKIGCMVRGLWGEGTEASGNIFQVSNQTTMGETEENLVGRLARIAQELIEHERNARGRLLEQRQKTALDYVGRALGVLSHAYVLSSKEVLYLLSGLRFGTEFGIVSGVKAETIDELMLLTQPGHLQRMANKVLSPQERDEVRASLVRARLKGVRMAGGA